MTSLSESQLTRRGFCVCGACATAFAASGDWLSPGQAFAKARGIVDQIKTAAAQAPIAIHPVRGNVAVLEGSGGNVAVVTGPSGKAMIDAGIAVSRPQVTEAVAKLGPEPVTHVINTHWPFDHADGNA